MNKTLLAIQIELKAPKNQYNSFGKYYYRNAEDILEGLKPLLKQYNSTVVTSDDLVQVGNRYYVKSTATLHTEEGEVSATGYAREADEQKGMNDAQITGSSSSYAKKYALGNLFAIDDTKDADSADNGNKTTPTPTSKPTATQSSVIKSETMTQANCPICKKEVSHKEGVSQKSGKAYKMYRCSANKDHVFWSGTADYEAIRRAELNTTKDEEISIDDIPFPQYE